jgi:peptidoglycan/xylan/chitin deacetylase (PgdA/CDA1 family)
MVVTLTGVPAHSAATAAKRTTTHAPQNAASALPRMSWTDYVRTKGSVPYLVDASVQASIKKCYNTTRNVWLTFDDGYTSQGNLNSILQTLSYFNVRGRFFLVGSWARQHPDMVNQIKAAGHYVENHTNTHAHLGQIGDADVSSQIEYGQASNSSPKLLRPPYGDGMFTTRLYYLAQQQGYQLCGWSTDSLDYAGVSAAVIVNKVVHGDFTTPPARPGATVLMHLENTQTRFALPLLIPALLAEGLPFDKLR